MDEPNFIPPLQEIIEPFLKEKEIHLFVLRTDLNHPAISGNKRYKLKYNLERLKAEQKNTLLTFGGAFSNHIAATAAAGKEQGLKTIGIIRGDATTALNHTLLLAQENGMHLHFVSRELYRDKDKLMQYVKENYGEEVYIVPEGGSNYEGVKGCMEIIRSIPVHYDIVCAPCGTGATISGIILSEKDHHQTIGFQILKAEKYIQGEVNKWLQEFEHPELSNWKINEDYHFGGYAKVNEELKDFVNHFHKKHQIQLDLVYTGKMMYGLYDMIKDDKFPKNKTIIAVHTGGLQGNKGFED